MCVDPLFLSTQLQRTVESVLPSAAVNGAAACDTGSGGCFHCYYVCPQMGVGGLCILCFTFFFSSISEFKTFSSGVFNVHNNLLKIFSELFLNLNLGRLDGSVD